MTSSDFMELEGDSDGVCSDIVGRNDIIRCIFAKLNFNSLIVKIVDNQSFEINFLFDEVEGEVIHFVFPFQNPFDVVDVNSEFLPDAIDVKVLEINIRPSETF